MQAITTIGLDIAKSVFQVHGVDAAGQVTIRRGGECRRAQRMEAELGMPELLWLSRHRCLLVSYNPGIPGCPQLVTWAFRGFQFP